jgi:plastocyanin
MTVAQAFSPETITVAVGDTVTWDNASSEQHTVTAVEDSLPDGSDYFASGGASTEDEAGDDLSTSFVGPGESYSHTFETPGTYRYYCIPHREAGMAGTVVVRAKSDS